MVLFQCNTEESEMDLHIWKILGMKCCLHDTEPKSKQAVVGSVQYTAAVAALEAKVQLQMKTNLERQLSQDNRLLMESLDQVSKQSKRLITTQ
jgi:hypothetical protein